MWKLSPIEEIIEIDRGIQEFISDFFEWVLNADASKNIDELRKQVTIKESRIGRVAAATNMKELIVLLAKSSHKKIIATYYEDLTSKYLDLVDGVIPPPPKLSPESRSLIREIFEYFYDSILDSKTFQQEYIPQYSGSTELKAYLRDKFGDSRKVCPYCDIQWIGHSAHSSIDHFFPKSSYPMLSIFISNLIVSCTGCNDRIKKAKLLLPLFHPHFHQAADHFEFVLDNECNNIVDIKLLSDQRDSHKRVVNYFQLFKLEELYASVLYKVKEDRRKLRETVRRLFLATNPSGDKQRVLRDILHEEISNRIAQNILKRGHFDLTKIKYDFLQSMKGPLFDIEIEYLSSHLRLDSHIGNDRSLKDSVVTDPNKIA
ncbi:hypothetical protein SAMN02799630_00554 [Paenibacillus sp. UNCCL117]|uniref:HNH endonuclease n=1 Tax=unclassified Paenibacillus TaxID=185978 RepID=UPI00088ABB33|nr:MULTISPECIES: hypothetical protein [unclassified Paenibacillus]SDC10908.1 hypothetical protein SAMN04488602_101354 [Paenibacillus sp. cl123]SFW16469.1 hypothetical protein SAMN02799630_00554 [Paenibacillus sp. UNCCL117]